jgi:hypothetical protein
VAEPAEVWVVSRSLKSVGLNSTLVADNFEKVMAGDLIADDVIRLNVRS